jgi:hypothetical protein
MNIVKSQEWELLSDVLKKEDPDTINYIFEFLTEETAKYEVGEAAYPKIEFAIAVAFDRKNEHRKQERLKQELLASSQIQTHTPNNVIEPIISPKTRREIIRNSWIQKFEREKIAETKKPEPEPEPEPEPKIISKPRIIKKRIVKKVESKSKSKS